mmetsp:Transcript_31891/g.95227  ORF Transcript_31891/g.95227 Transcript_31891/m.95227 type:complete len:360 (-) Transcript_31891:281-1360(-)
MGRGRGGGGSGRGSARAHALQLLLRVAKHLHQLLVTRAPVAAPGRRSRLLWRQHVPQRRLLRAHPGAEVSAVDEAAEELPQVCRARIPVSERRRVLHGRQLRHEGIGVPTRHQAVQPRLPVPCKRQQQSGRHVMEVVAQHVVVSRRQSQHLAASVARSRPLEPLQQRAVRSHQRPHCRRPHALSVAMHERLHATHPLAQRAHRGAWVEHRCHRRRAGGGGRPRGRLLPSHAENAGEVGQRLEEVQVCYAQQRRQRRVVARQRARRQRPERGVVDRVVRPEVQPERQRRRQRYHGRYGRRCIPRCQPHHQQRLPEQRHLPKLPQPRQVRKQGSEQVHLRAHTHTHTHACKRPHGHDAATW